MKVRKAIIPAAGLGTRFLPATKALPKEMLPIIDKPTIQYIVEEAIMSGIEDIIIVTGKGKRAIEDHFDYSFELENHLLKKGKHALLKEVRMTSQMIDIHYIRQKEPLGLGHAIWCARNFIGNEPFAVLLGDIITDGEKFTLQQMIKLYEKLGASIIGVEKVPDEEVSRYGIVNGLMIDERLLQLTQLIEKPDLIDAPSNMAIIGRYVLTPEIFNILENQIPGVSNEIQLTDALSSLMEKQKVYAYLIDGNSYDIGEKLGFITTTIEMALKRDDIKYPLRKYLLNLIEKLRTDLD